MCTLCKPLLNKTDHSPRLYPKVLRSCTLWYYTVCCVFTPKVKVIVSEIFVVRPMSCSQDFLSCSIDSIHFSQPERLVLSFAHRQELYPIKHIATSPSLRTEAETSAWTRLERRDSTPVLSVLHHTLHPLPRPLCVDPCSHSHWRMGEPHAGLASLHRR